jgi:hypothetical protein
MVLCFFIWLSFSHADSFKVTDSQPQRTSTGETKEAARTTILQPKNQNCTSETNKSCTKCRKIVSPPSPSQLSPTLESEHPASALESEATLTPARHLSKLASSIHHAVFALPYLTKLADQLNDNQLQLFSHVPFTPPGPALFPFLDLSTDELNMTTVRNYHIIYRLQFLGEAAAEAPDEESQKHFLLRASQYVGNLSL